MRNEELTELLTPVVADLGLECLGVEYSPSHGNSLVRVYIDAPDRAVTVDDCEAASEPADQRTAPFPGTDPRGGRIDDRAGPGRSRSAYRARERAQGQAGAGFRRTGGQTGQRQKAEEFEVRMRK